ncbi:tumor necrosis factor receptor superfamily member 9a [Hemiscyllium ocellatum]|uniref:tumor necrosis factor receptor superfamily member 9a n=1 Tax=Hemiscyllium ocellatum TaxID=170820 RepID=UPI002966CC5B|nr:tumor necrosis factor receptor superfamily member 9a [Hemiscyllium ocellatum]
MSCFMRTSMITAFLILITTDLIETSGLPKFITEHQRFKYQVSQHKCPPGTYKVSSSSYSSNGQTQCARCEEGTYTEKENSLKECRKCYGPCTGNSIETVQCTPTTNRKCECDFHYYCVTDDPAKCEHCKECGDKKPMLSDKEDYYKQACQPCPPGTFLNTTPKLKCQPHTNCTDLGKILHTRGNSTADNSCVESLSTGEGNVSCITKNDKKCECPLGYYCAVCGDGKNLPLDKQHHQKEMCQPCPPGSFRNITQRLKCQPHTNCSLLGKMLYNEGNSTVDNYCINPHLPVKNPTWKERKSFTSYMVWIVVPLAILCVIITMRTSLCKVSKKQGIGMLVKLKFICICGVKSDIYKGSTDEAEINAGAVPEAEKQCLNGLNSDSKPATAMMPLISNKTNKAPMYKSDIFDIETVSVVVHPKDSTEDNIPFPVQENGRNSNTYYPIEEQNQKQYSEPVTMGSKNSTQTSEYFKNNK